MYPFAGFIPIKKNRARHGAGPQTTRQVSDLCLIMLVSFIASNSIVGFNFIPIVEARRGVFRS